MNSSGAGIGPGSQSLHAGCRGKCCLKNFCEKCGVVKCKCAQPGKWADGTLNTTYKAHYPPKQGLRDGPFRPPNADYSAPFDGRTTYTNDFVPKKGGPERAGRRADGLPDRPFDGQTTYNAFHDGKRGPPAAANGKPPCAYSAPFEGGSSYKSDYPGWDARRQARTAPGYKALNQPFDGTTTYNTEFVKKRIPDRDPHAKAVLLPSINTANPTTYGVDMVPKPFIRHQKVCCDIATHRATTVKLTPEGTRPWSAACSSCVGDHGH